MNYKIILDEKALIDFIDWLPDLEEDERFYVSLMARKKYNPIIKGDKNAIKRVASRKEDLFSKIKQMEIPLDSYTSKGINIPNDSLVLYMTLNPRSLRIASFNTIEDLLKDIKNNKKRINPYSVSLSSIHRAKSRSVFHTFDVDSKEGFQEKIDELNNLFDSDFFKVIETRGGFHVVFTMNKATDQHWYSKTLKILNPDQSGDLMSPICGCIQGDYMVHFQ